LKKANEIKRFYGYSSNRMQVISVVGKSVFIRTSSPRWTTPAEAPATDVQCAP
jgi:hypothetical protein